MVLHSLLCLFYCFEYYLKIFCYYIVFSSFFYLQTTKKLKEKEIKRQEHIYEFILTEKHHCLTLRVMQKVKICVQLWFLNNFAFSVICGGIMT